MTRGTCRTRAPRKDLEIVSQTPAVLIRAKSWTMRGTTRLLQELRGWHLVCKVRRFGHAAQSPPHRCESAPHPRFWVWASPTRVPCVLGRWCTVSKKLSGDNGADGRNIGKGEGQMESHDIHIAHTFHNIKPLEPCVCPHA